MKKYLLSLAVLVMFATPAHAFTVTCTNCSNMLVQMLDRVTNVEQLTSMIKQYQEAVEQTRQQINMCARTSSSMKTCSRTRQSSRPTWSMNSKTA